MFVCLSTQALSKSINTTSPGLHILRLGLWFAYMKTSLTILALSIASGLSHHSAVTPLPRQLFLHAETGLLKKETFWSWYVSAGSAVTQFWGEMECYQTKNKLHN